MKKANQMRAGLESLACINPGCELYGQPEQENLTVRKVYGNDGIRYLRCRRCQCEFSERKNTGLWNTKIAETKAIAVAEHLAEGCSLKGIARLVKVDASTVRRLNQRIGAHGAAFHQARAQNVQVKVLEGDERHGYAGNKQQPAWEGELFDPASKFVLSHVQGERDQTLIERLLRDGASRLATPKDLVLMTDGDANYAALFPAVFGQPYQPPRQGGRGRLPLVQFRIPRTLAHVQVIKHRTQRRLVQLEIRYTHGSQKRVRQALTSLGYKLPNTSAIERRNGTHRLMTSFQTRKTLAFARRPETKAALGWWNTTVYNWCRPHRSLRQLLAVPTGHRLYQQRSPAMAIGLANRIFSIAELLLFPVYP